MREIKFRAWDRVGRFFAALGEDPDYMMGFDKDGEVFIIDDGQPLPQRFDIQQFTSLHDKNGREIYEGDVVRGQWDDCGTFGNMSCRVEWDAEFGMWIFIDIDPAYSEQNHLTWPYFVDGTAEVIGNIYENPELLDGSQMVAAEVNGERRIPTDN